MATRLNASFPIYFIKRKNELTTWRQHSDAGWFTKCLGGVRLADGTLAGSTLTMDQALRNLVAIGATIHDASNRLSANPARFLGITDRGRLAQNCWADLVVFNRDL